MRCSGLIIVVFANHIRPLRADPFALSYVVLFGAVFVIYPLWPQRYRTCWMHYKAIQKDPCYIGQPDIRICSRRQYYLLLLQG